MADKQRRHEKYQINAQKVQIWCMSAWERNEFEIQKSTYILRHVKRACSNLIAQS